ncbi:hypothetical protein J2129_001084 [Methanofollis sp. W23]|nr:hypothetical protein [Methanofollis sp. W23]
MTKGLPSSTYRVVGVRGAPRPPPERFIKRISTEPFNELKPVWKPEEMIIKIKLSAPAM